jgi:PAS domain S-box-containing protein
LSLSTVHPDDRARVRTALATAVRGGPPLSIDHRIVRPDGKIRIVHQQSEIKRDDRGIPVLMFGTMHDVTEQRATEQAGLGS